jgi:checkpoint serine/threonine-protein kinase
MGSDDLIDFDIIENQKENIQSLPSGRSAKALAQLYTPPLTSAAGRTPSPSQLHDANHAKRQEFEKELQAIDDSDDPLDVYDRYVKWTLDAYPSAQNTPQSQLCPLLERATKAFQSSTHYKNDPRYLKLWLHYIRLFSDAPRETFAYLARHNIGDGLALFYEEFAAWLETAGRWKQAEEVYAMGIEHEARPTERLIRKYGEFQHRFESRPQQATEPTSPALPTIRPALAAKVDPFAHASPSAVDPQAQSRARGGASAPKSGKPKLAIFSDGDEPEKPGSSGSLKGWDSIGSLADRKKENTTEARPWAGETLKVGKKNTAVQKMMIFKDEVSFIPTNSPSRIYGRRTNDWRLLCLYLRTNLIPLTKTQNLIHYVMSCKSLTQKPEDSRWCSQTFGRCIRTTTIHQHPNSLSKNSERSTVVIQRKTGRLVEERKGRWWKINLLTSYHWNKRRMTLRCSRQRNLLKQQASPRQYH